MASRTINVSPTPLAHSALDDLDADDHDQYALSDGSRGTFAAAVTDASGDDLSQQAFNELTVSRITTLTSDVGTAVNALEDADDLKLNISDARVLPTPVGATDGHVATIDSDGWVIAAAGAGSLDALGVALISQVYGG